MADQTTVEAPATAMDTNVIDQNTNETKQNKDTTVFDDPVNYTVKHPLQHKWTLWFDNPGKKANSQSWGQHLKEVISVDTVEDFWGVYNNVVKVDRLDVSSNYHLFKVGVRPEWEDAANANGGKFSIQFPRNRTGEQINDFWLQTMLAMLGEQFASEDEICGAVVSVRKVFFRIALWIKSSENKDVIKTIGQQLKDFLKVPPNIAVEFAPHGDGKGQSRMTI